MMFFNRFKIRILLMSIVFLFLGCFQKKEEKKEYEKGNFLIQINTHRAFLEKSYLGKVVKNTAKIIDTVAVEQGKCTFSGSLVKPQRMVLFFDNTWTKPFAFLLENKTIQIDIDPNDLSKGTIKNSPINTIYDKYQKESSKILQKINPFYYQIQQARLQNNTKKLQKINANIASIQQEFLDYSFKYIQKHSSSYASLFILKDLLKTAQIDTLTYQKKYKTIIDN